MEFSVLDLDSLNDFDFYQMRQFDDVFSPEPIPDDSRHGDHHKVEEERRQLDYSPLSSKVEDSSLVFNLQSPAAAITSPPTSLFSMQRQHCGEILPSDAGRCSTSSAASPADPTVSVSGCCFAPAADAKDADNIDVKPVSARRGRKRLPETCVTKEDERKQRRRASNRRAAERYRQKQKATVDDFKAEHQKTVKENARLKGENRRLAAEAKMKQQLIDQLVAQHSANSVCTSPVSADYQRLVLCYNQDVMFM